MTIFEIIAVIEDFAPRAFQESWDNTGVQVGDVSGECSGVLLCVDVTPGVIDEACSRGCNLVVSHHPLLFHGLKSITGSTPVEKSVISAIRNGIAIYSCHTAADSARGGVSHEMAARLGARVTGLLSPSQSNPGIGLGVVAEFETPLNRREFVSRVRQAFNSPVVRATEPPDADVAIRRIAMCGGAGGEFISRAIDVCAQAYISSDTRYHEFVGYQRRIWLIDIGHYESESCTKDIFYRVISKKFPNFAVYYSDTEENPIKYIN